MLFVRRDEIVWGGDLWVSGIGIGLGSIYLFKRR